jgi:hypothetical protein
MLEDTGNEPTGLKFGRLLVGDLVRNVRDHELYDTTRASYISQGRLYECWCDCGQRVLLSENAIRGGRVQSCGCLRAEKRQKAYEEKLARAQRLADKRELTHKIRMAQDRLRLLKMAPVMTRNEKAIDEQALEVRKLRAMKASATRVSNGQAQK